MKNRAFLLVLFVGLLTQSLLGCASMYGPSINKMDMLDSDWKQQNERISQTQGERVLDKDYDRAFSSIITALADFGWPVKNIERQSGYILAEGPHPLDSEKAMALAKEAAKETSSNVGGRWLAKPGNAFYSATVSVYRFAPDKSKVKIRVSALTVASTGSRYHQLYPPLHSEILKELWARIDRQTFLDEHLD